MPSSKNLEGANPSIFEAFERSAHVRIASPRWSRGGWIVGLRPRVSESLETILLKKDRLIAAHRELLGDRARLTYDTVRELMTAAVGGTLRSCAGGKAAAVHSRRTVTALRDVLSMSCGLLIRSSSPLEQRFVA